MRVQSRSTTIAPSILASSRSRGRAELHVEHEAAGAQALDDLVVAEDDEGAGAAAQDALQAVAQRGARGHRRERRAQRVVEPFGACHLTAPARQP